MITIHIIVHDAAAAADWYSSVLGAQEEHRITLADGRLIDLEMRLGQSKVVLADEFPEHEALSPKTTGASVGGLLSGDGRRRCHCGSGGRRGRPTDPSGG